LIGRRAITPSNSAKPPVSARDVDIMHESCILASTKNDIPKIHQLPGCLPEGYTLDSMLTPEQFCLWQQVKRRWLTHRPRLKGLVHHSREMIRIHPRTYLDGNVKGR
jgi:hypothetical protein